MQLGYTILYVPDVRRSVAFYGEAFGLKPAFVNDSGDFASLDTGATARSFYALSLLAQMGKTPGRPDPARPCFEIALTTPDVPALYSHGVTGTKAIRPQP